jgi:hypothetical protein
MRSVSHREKGVGAQGVGALLTTTQLCFLVAGRTRLVDGGELSALQRFLEAGGGFEAEVAAVRQGGGGGMMALQMRR